MTGPMDDVSDVGDVQLTRGAHQDLEDLRPVWLAVHARHRQTMPALGRYVDDVESWSRRREVYATLLASPRAVLIRARVDGELVGYGVAHVMRSAETWLADTWRTGDSVGEVESLGVLPGFRGRGIGTRLLDALEQALRDDGVRDVVIGLLAGNDGALRLYERRGYRPTWLYVSRLHT